MKTSSLLGNVGFAIALSILTAVLVCTVPVVAPRFWPTLCLVGILLFWVGFLVMGARRRPGRVFAAVALPVVVTVTAFFFGTGLAVLAAIGGIWFMRSLFNYDSITGAVLDGMITGIACFFGLWGFLFTHSIVVGVWLFALISALAALVPPKPQLKRLTEREVGAEGFTRSARAAEAALRRMAVR